MLLAGDVTAVTAFHQHARWDYIRRMLPPACLGVMLAASVMRGLDDALYKPVIGWIILALPCCSCSGCGARPGSAAFRTRGCSPGAPGCWSGAATMLANAAGPIFALYTMSIALPKLEMVGTSAWFFLMINAFKVPFSLGLGLIHGQTLLLNLALVPVILVGVFSGRWVVRRLPQRAFEILMLAFAGVASMRLIGVVLRDPGRM